MEGASARASNSPPWPPHPSTTFGGGGNIRFDGKLGIIHERQRLVRRMKQVGIGASTGHSWSWNFWPIASSAFMDPVELAAYVSLSLHLISFIYLFWGEADVAPIETKITRTTMAAIKHWRSSPVLFHPPRLLKMFAKRACRRRRFSSKEKRTQKKNRCEYEIDGIDPACVCTQVHREWPCWLEAVE